MQQHARHSTTLHAWWKMASKAGCDMIKQPSLNRVLPGQPQLPANSRMDLLMCLKTAIMHKLVLCNVMVTHPIGASYLLRAFNKDGAPAAIVVKAIS
jgi:hypothetical protein